MFQSLDHVAIVVRDTEIALQLYRDTLGLTVLFSEVLEEQAVRLTHLDLHNTHLQLVQPLSADHPLSKYIDEHGEGLHHICFKVDNVSEAMIELRAHGLPSRDLVPRRGPQGH